MNQINFCKWDLFSIIAGLKFKITSHKNKQYKSSPNKYLMSILPVKYNDNAIKNEIATIMPVKKLYLNK